MGIASLATTDQAFVRAHHRVVDGLAVEALRGVKLERRVDAQHVDGAHLRHHVAAINDHDLIEAVLRADLFRHHLAEATQQDARTTSAPRMACPPGSRLTGASPVELGSTVKEFARDPARHDHPQAYIECGTQTASQRQRYDGMRFCRCSVAPANSRISRIQGPVLSSP